MSEDEEPWKGKPRLAGGMDAERPGGFSNFTEYCVQSTPYSQSGWKGHRNQFQPVARPSPRRFYFVDFAGPPPIYSSLPPRRPAVLMHHPSQAHLDIQRAALSPSSGPSNCAHASLSGVRRMPPVRPLTYTVLHDWLATVQSTGLASTMTSTF